MMIFVDKTEIHKTSHNKQSLELYQTLLKDRH